MNRQPTDILCQKLLESFAELTQVLTSDAGKKTFDIETSAHSAEAFNELRRLHRSLRQYAEKSKALTYVGFVGHFSAGKSSTTNSLLRSSSADPARLTGLHPTDKANTLITHKNNSSNLIGAHTRGEVEVGASLLDVESLKDVVIVDTPGSGDPLVVEEIVRDFLPICDQLSYTFSAASALAVSDLPMLVKIHKDQPFLPVRSVVTRADEFTRDVDARATSANVDNSRIDTFIGELISRIAASVPGLNIAQEDIMLIDNVSGFNVESLPGFIFSSVPHTNVCTIQPQQVGRAVGRGCGCARAS